MRSVSWLALSVAILPVLAPARASACGGFFCSSSPIQQSSERVLYAYEADGSLTMAVEIQYAGFDDDFAWILPVPLPPTISLGTSALFDAVDGASAPRFPLSETTVGTCREVPRCVREDGSEPFAASCGYTYVPEPTDYVDTTPPPPPGPMTDPPPGSMDGLTIYSEGPIGPYETVVLGAATASEVVAWLGAHDYDIPGASLPLLEPYAALGHVFVALRLRANRVSSVLRPIVLRTPAPASGIAEACLPIRLTAIATTPALGITAFFLGDQLVTPANYSIGEVDLAGASLYRNGPSAYDAAVAAAADRRGGHAFVTDYAGRTPLLSIPHASVLDLATTTAPQTFLRALVTRGYRGDALLLELLERYLVPPAGTDARTFYNCLATGSAGCGTPRAFDPAALASAIEQEIVRPRAEAEALLRRHARLTRLSTELGPAEMTIDPVFVRDPGTPEVSNVHVGTLVRRCSPTYFRQDAPVDLVVGDRTTAWDPGRVTTDEEYCMRFSAMVADGRPTARAAECGYGCNAGLTAVPLPAALALSMMLAPLVLRRRNRSG
jgi:hypothetical protein